MLGMDLGGVEQLVARAMGDAPRAVTDGLARAVRGVPDDRLEQALRTPMRRVVLDGIFWQMPQHLDRTRAVGVNATVRWQVTGRGDGGADTYDLVLGGGRCQVRRGAKGDARLTITLGAAELVRLASGGLDPMQAYYRRRIKLAGDIMLAAKLTALFRIPTASRRTGADPRS
jgi:putative sterol carrier protein